MKNNNDEALSKKSAALSALKNIISDADIYDLRSMNNDLDDLKSMIEDHIMALAGHGGDY